MVVVSLKTLILCGLLLIAGVAWALLLYVRVNRLRLSRFDQVLSAIPLSALIFSGSRLRRANAAAQAFLHLHPDIETTVGQISLEIAAQSIHRSGTLILPYPLRWWGANIEAQHVVLFLLDASDEQTLLARQQQFVGQLSHELRTPLTALTAHAEIALREHTDNEVLHTSLQIIRRETQRSARLVRDLVELYRLEACGQLSLRRANLVLIAEAAIAQVILYVEQRGQQLRFNADAGLPQVLVDPDRITQVFVNLLQNAVTYARSGDTITVNLLHNDCTVLCEVADTGPGIDEVDLPHVTERLYRGQSGSDGSGLGLAIVSEILRQHDATLTISSLTVGPQTGTICRWTLNGVGPVLAQSPASMEMHG